MAAAPPPATPAQTTTEGGTQNGESEKKKVVETAEQARISRATFAQQTSGGVIPQLIHILQNERAAPEILPWPGGLVDSVVRAIAERQQFTQAQPSENDDPAASLLPFRGADIYRMEIQRVQYLLTDFIRTRIRKVQARCLRIYHLIRLQEAHDAKMARMSDGADPEQQQQQVPEEQLPDRDHKFWSMLNHLSENEKLMAIRLAEMAIQAVRDGGLKHLPPEVAGDFLVPVDPLKPTEDEAQQIKDMEHMDQYVLVRIIEDLGSIEMGSNQQQECREGNIFVTKYSNFRDPYIINGKVRMM